MCPLLTPLEISVASSIYENPPDLKVKLKEHSKIGRLKRKMEGNQCTIKGHQTGKIKNEKQQQQQQQLPIWSRFRGIWGDPDVNNLTFISISTYKEVDFNRST